MLEKRDRPVIPQWVELTANGREPGSIYHLEIYDFDLTITKMITSEHWWLTMKPMSLLNQQLRNTGLAAAKLEALGLLVGLLQRNLMELGRAISASNTYQRV